MPFLLCVNRPCMPSAIAIRLASALCTITLSSLCAAPALSAESGAVRGTVFDGSTGQPIQYAALALIEKADGRIVRRTATDARGSFDFDSVPFGIYVASYALVGGDVTETPVFGVTAQRPAVDLGRLTLVSDEKLKMGRVVVTARREESYNSIDRRVYNVGKDVQSSAGSASDLLQNVPSVQIDIDGNVSLRGDQNVLVLIDGKPSALMSAANRPDALAQMAADSIERIEVITNPSAKFKPDGTAGIINIVLKRKHDAGYSGTFRANVGNDSRSNYGLSGNYNPGKYNITGNLSVRKDFRPRYSQESRSHLDTASNTFISTKQSTTERMRPLTRIAEIGADYNIDDDDQLGATVDYNYRTFHRTSTITNVTQAADGTETSDYDRMRSDPEWQKTLGLGTTYRHSFSEKGHELSAEIKRERHWEQEDNQYTNVYPTPPAPTSFDYTLIRPTETGTDLSADYSRPMSGDAKLEAGYAGEVDKDDMNFLGGYFDPASGTWLVDATQTNRFIYRDSIQAIYATYGRPLGRFAFLGGLRLEKTFIDTNQVTTQVRDKNDYLRLYPTLHLNYDLTETGQLVLNYSHRIHRPEGEDLNPFPEYQDPFNLRAGNPMLGPEETHSIESGYQYRKDETTLLAAVYLRDTYHAFTTVTRYIDSVTLLTTEENLASSRSGGVELILTTPLGQSATLNVSANAYDNEVDASNLGYSGNRSTMAWDAKLRVEWRVSKADDVQLNLNYSGRRLTAQGYRLPNDVANLGFRHEFKVKNITFVLTVSDLFDSLKERTVIDTPVLHDYLMRRRTSRIIYAGFIYNFGSPAKTKKDDTLQYDNQL
jgi:outer membrane receptor protein involved in Fe transport